MVAAEVAGGGPSPLGVGLDALAPSRAHATGELRLVRALVRGGERHVKRVGRRGAHDAGGANIAIGAGRDGGVPVLLALAEVEARAPVEHHGEISVVVVVRDATARGGGAQHAAEVRVEEKVRGDESVHPIVRHDRDARVVDDAGRGGDVVGGRVQPRLRREKREAIHVGR